MNVIFYGVIHRDMYGEEKITVSESRYRMKERDRLIPERLICIGKNSYFNVMIKETAVIRFRL